MASKTHKIPAEEQELHEQSLKCHCKPKVYRSAGGVVVEHRSVNGLDQLVAANRILGLPVKKDWWVNITESLNK